MSCEICEKFYHCTIQDSNGSSTHTHSHYIELPTIILFKDYNDIYTCEHSIKKIIYGIYGAILYDNPCEKYIKIALHSIHKKIIYNGEYCDIYKFEEYYRVLDRCCFKVNMLELKDCKIINWSINKCNTFNLQIELHEKNQIIKNLKEKLIKQSDIIDQKINNELILMQIEDFSSKIHEIENDYNELCEYILPIFDGSTNEKYEIILMQSEDHLSKTIQIQYNYELLSKELDDLKEKYELQSEEFKELNLEFKELDEEFKELEDEMESKKFIINRYKQKNDYLNDYLNELKNINNEIILMQSEDHLSKTLQIQYVYNQKIKDYENLLEQILNQPKEDILSKLKNYVSF